MNRSLPLICVALLAGCAAKPVPEMPTLADVSLAEDAVSLAIAEAVGGEASPETSKGILGRMFGARTPPAPVAVVAEGAEDITTPIDLVDVACKQQCMRRGLAWVSKTASTSNALRPPNPNLKNRGD